MKQSPNGHPHLAPLASPHLGEDGVEYIGKSVCIHKQRGDSPQSSVRQKISESAMICRMKFT